MVTHIEPNKSNYSMKTHLLKVDMIRGEKRDKWWLSQPNIANNSMKTHRLKHRHDRRREKRHVVVTCSMQIYSKLFKKNSPAETCMYAKL